jgi:hypothetical protein
MNKIQTEIVVFLTCFVFSISFVCAQSSMPLLKNTLQLPLYSGLVGSNSAEVNSQKIFLEPVQQIHSVCAIWFDSRISKGAIFCRMEQDVYRKYNLQLRIRAGDFDSYRKYELGQ